MTSTAFAKPVYLKDGKAFVREIASAEDAVDYLMAWPERDRDALHAVTLKACTMARDGLKPVKAARDAIRAFAAKHGILEKAPAVKPWMIPQVSGGRIQL